MKHLLPLGIALVLASGAGCSRAPRTALQVVEWSVRAHGGDRLSNWKTITIAGTVDIEDGITYHAAYTLQAKAPDKLRVEHDLTADRGRRFDEYFLNGGTAWMRRSLVVAPTDARRLQRWLNQCYGPASYLQHAEHMTLEPDEVVEWKVPETEGSNTLKVIDRRPARVVRITAGEDRTDLSFDKERYYLLQEVHYRKDANGNAVPEARRVYWDFKDFGGVTFATRVNEFTFGRQGETLALPILQASVTYDLPLEDWLFEEDRPQAIKPLPSPR